MKFSRKILTLVISASLIMGSVQVAFASAATAASAIPPLTVEEAAMRAIRNNTSIANAEGDESVADEVVKRAQDAVFEAVTSATLTNAMIGLMNAELSRSLNIRDLVAQRQNVEFQITRYFNTILNMENDLALLFENLAMAKRELVIAELRLSLGLMSELDFEAAEFSVVRIETNIGLLESSIERAFRDLNSFMGVYGIDLDQRYELKLELSEFTPLPAVNLNHHAQRFVTESLRVQQAENAVQTARYRLDHYVTPHNELTGQIVPGQTREEVEVDLSRVTRALADTRQVVRENVLNMHSDLRTSELRIRADELELERLQRQLEVSETMLELGRTTPMEIDALRLNITSQENALAQAKNSHTILAFAFNNPNIIMGQ